MEEKHSVKLNHLDLAKKRLELEEIFESIINKIPDLCMPVSVRLSGENDFFNQTKGLRLVPFRKQRIFDTCISPELSNESDTTGKEVSVSSLPLQMTTGLRSSAKDDFVRHKNVKVSFKQCEVIEKKEVRPEMVRLKSDKVGKGTKDSSASKQSTRKSSELQLELDKKRKIRAQLMENYSKLGLARRKSSPVDVHQDATFDLLFAPGPDENYPFANPMPACMLTRDNINNLGDIIVGSHEIEWRMLTSKRPTDDLEEKYFDRLIELHRNRLRSRQDCGCFATNQRLPFVHVRHAYEPKYLKIGIRSIQSRCSRHCSPLSLAVESKRRFRNRLKSNDNLGTLGNKLNIPTLILTSDEKSSAPIVGSPSASDDHEELEGFDYENFSRFSRTNRRQQNSALVVERETSSLRKQHKTFGSELRTGKQLVGKPGRASETDQDETSTFGDTSSAGSGEDVDSKDHLNEQVEEIMSNLIGANLLAD